MPTVPLTAALPEHGLWLYRASRLEALVDPLQALLRAWPPDSVLAPQRVVVADAGMREWLLTELAQRAGRTGIVANIDAIAPGAWLEDLARSVLHENPDAASPWRRERLRWRIHAALAELDDARMRTLLAGPEGERQRVALADRLARILVQYLVYRPDWLAAWQAGRTPGDLPTDAARLLAPVWRSVRAAIAAPHRGERLPRLVAALRRAPLAGSAPVHLFGLSHLAPADMAVLHAYARQAMAVVYVADPCRESWVGMASRRTALRRLASEAADARASEMEFLQANHPLLGGLGRIGQHFLLQLEDGPVAVDERHHLDQPEAQLEPANLLQWLQEGIRRAEPALPRPQDASAGTRQDASLRVHLCHTRLRELEVLRDALLQQWHEHPDLAPEEVVVTAPDIAAYAPLLPAVFGPAGAGGALLPWHLADATAAVDPPLHVAFRHLLDLPGSRLTAPQVADLLGLAPIRARLGLSESDADRLVESLRQMRVAWGLDAEFRAGQGVPAIDAQTLAWGMDRLLAGHVVGDLDAGGTLSLPDDEAIAPVAGEALLTGALDQLLAELAQWSAAASGMRRMRAWVAWLQDRQDALLCCDRADADAERAWLTLRAVTARLAEETSACGLDPSLPFAAVRDLLLAALVEARPAPSARPGAITVCGMMAARAIPRRVIAVLGLDDGALPRAIDDAGLDPIHARPRIGDRDARQDDRWLFLQTLMAARDALHLSFVGESPRDGTPRNPAAPLAELINLLDPDPRPLVAAADAGEADRAAALARRPWFVRHPLQPFDGRYFDGSDPALFTFDAAAAALDPSPRRTPPVAATAQDETKPALVELDLRDVLAWLKDPARQHLRHDLGVHLDALDEAGLAECELLTAEVAPIDRLARQVFLDALVGSTRTLPATAPAGLRARALLAAGEPGEQAWRTEREKVAELLARYGTHPLLATGTPRPLPIEVDVRWPALRVHGRAERVVQGTDGRWVFDTFPGKAEDDLDFGKRGGLFLEWALLRLSAPADAGSLRMLAACAGGGDWQDAINAWDERYCTVPEARAGLLADLRARVAAVLTVRAAGRIHPLRYFPRTSWSAATGVEDIAARWVGSDFIVGERDYAPGYARLLAGDTRFAAGSREHAELVATAQVLRDAIDLRRAAPGAVS